MIGKFGGKQSLEDAMMYLIVIVGVGLGLGVVGAYIEDEADKQAIELQERLVAFEDSALAKSGYYDKSISAKIVLKDVGGWMKLIGIVLLGVGLLMMRTAKSKL